jgi:hypothetical protein
MNRLLVCVAALAATVALSAASASASPTIPNFKARDAGVATPVGTDVGPAGLVIQTHDTGSGIATHLGRYTLDAGEGVDLATGAIHPGEGVNLTTRVITDGSFTLTGASGDTISGIYSGHALAGLTGYVVSGPITGGTGRFAGATGFLTWKGTLETLDSGALTFTDEITGTISAIGG